ncbi:MAG: dual-specificity RNA methyltransferase RlmN [Planctomycetota bacterium]|jgi:23S rRNA (adenine2503-C2)-methyltransferase
MDERVRKPNLKALLPEEAEALLVSLGRKPYRARQILRELHRRGAGRYDAMTSLPKPLREQLAEEAPLKVLDPVGVRESSDGAAKFLLRTDDGLLIEAVRIVKGKFRTVCLSTQAGCPLGCVFCATGRAGFRRNLRPEEIVDQALVAGRDAPGGPGPTHVVLMGMGEPLLNTDAVFRAVRILVHPDAGGLSPGRLTLSTAGIVEGLRRLMKADLKVNLALSLNATRDAQRRELMPVARSNPLEDVLAAFRAFPASKRNPRTIEYVLLAGVNDALEDGSELARIARAAGAKVNLIPFNGAENLPFRAPEEKRIESLLRILTRGGVSATVRRSKGASIAAACGQLAAEPPYGGSVG